MSVPPPNIPSNSAFFFDFDGTLVDIAPRPELVRVEPHVISLLGTLSGQFDHAVAIVTGRPVNAVDDFLEPLKLAVAGEHGSIRRDADGLIHRDERGAEIVAAAERDLQEFVAANPGLLLERKTASVALHYRQRPELAGVCAKVVEDFATNHPGVVVLHGKKVLELRPEGVDKGVALRAFMNEPPFQGRVPIFVGDDVTDEHAFAAVNEMGGISVKIDEGETIAKYRTDRPGLFRWLSGGANNLRRVP